jgi:hypothetical protein
MRVSWGLLSDRGLLGQLDDRLVETGNEEFCDPHALDSDNEADEDSDAGDPQALAENEVKEIKNEVKEIKENLAQEGRDLLAFCQASQSTLESRAMSTDVERARMQMEDMRSHVMRQ